jgi:hypothetical protein
VTLRRVDAAGDRAPISLPRATIASSFVHTISGAA